MKKLIIILALVVGASVTLLYYAWRQATKLPEWYSLPSSTGTVNQEFSNPLEVRAAEARVQAKIEAAKSSLPPVKSANTPNQDNYDVNNQQSSQNKNVEIELSNQEVNDLVTTSVAKHLERQKNVLAVPKFHTTIKNGVFESGTVVNLAELSNNQLTANETQVLEKVQKTFPFIKNQKIYVGISGQPKIENGQLKLDNDSQVKLGNLSISLSTLSQRLNIPQAQLEEKLNRMLQVGSLKVNDMELIDNRIRLRGSVSK